MNKKDKRKIRTLTGLLVLVLVVVGSFVSANAASAKLNKKKATVTVGKTVKLKVKNTGSKVKWTSSNKKVATVKKSGKYGAVVTGKKAGKATITAKVGKKKLKCKVTVKKKSSSSSSTSKKFVPSSSAHKLNDLVGVVAIGKTVDLFEYVKLGALQKAALTNSVRKNYFQWTTSDSSVFSINKYGIGTAKKTGTVKVRVKSKSSNGTWKTSNAITVKVRDIGDVSMTFQTGLNKEWVQNNNHLNKIYNQYGTQVNYFNYVVCNVKNDSNNDIYMNRILSLNTPDGAGVVGTGGIIGYTSNITDDVDYDAASYNYCFFTENRTKIIVPKHTSLNVVYRNEKLLCSLGDKAQFGPSYTLNNELLTPIYYVKSNTWVY